MEANQQRKELVECILNKNEELIYCYQTIIRVLSIAVNCTSNPSAYEIEKLNVEKDVEEEILKLTEENSGWREELDKEKK